MHLRSGLILLLPLATLTACASPRFDQITIRPERAGPCTPGAPCELAGQLLLHSEPRSYNTATIDQAHSTCIPVLVPESVFAAYDRWQGKQARVRGTALARVRLDDEVGRVKYRDRWLLEGICGNSEIVVYVDKIALER